MKNTSLTFFMIAIICWLAAASEVFAQSDSCSIIITSPERDGINVGRSMEFEGTAIIPDGAHLWVFCKESSFQDVWWIQNTGKIDADNHTWKVNVTFGEVQDIGHNFDVMVLAVNQTDHILLQNKYYKMLTDGVYTPMMAPKSLCPPVYRTVTKNSH